MVRSPPTIPRAERLSRVLLTRDTPCEPEDSFCVGGIFHEALVRALNEPADFLRRDHQTIATFGVSRERLLDLARTVSALGGFGWVPMGAAGIFAQYWAGIDLLAAFSRHVVVRGGV